MVLVKKAYNYMPRAKALERVGLKLKRELIVNEKADKGITNKVDLPLNNLSVININNIIIIVKKEL